MYVGAYTLTVPVAVDISEVWCSVTIAIESAFYYVWYKIVVRVRVQKVPNSITICKKNKLAKRRNVMEISAKRLLHAIGLMR